MTFTLVLRRIHMYLGLFLTPWVLVYGLSAVVMSHLAFFADFYGSDWGSYYVEKEMTYHLPEGTAANAYGGQVSGAAASQPFAGADPWVVGRQILRDLGLEGPYWADFRANRSRIEINRNALVAPRRITYSPQDGKLVVERQTFQWPLFLRRLHIRRGYGSPYLASDAWALVVDLFIVATLAWGGTGLWMWYKMKPTRRWGTLCAATGGLLFAVFLLAI